MSSVLKNLYNGQLCPAERNLARGAETKAYSKLLEAQDTAAKRLKASLDEQSTEDFKAYCALQTQISLIEQEDLFLYALRLGARLEQALFAPRTDGISAEDL